MGGGRGNIERMVNLRFLVSKYAYILKFSSFGSKIMDTHKFQSFLNPFIPPLHGAYTLLLINSFLFVCANRS